MRTPTNEDAPAPEVEQVMMLCALAAERGPWYIRPSGAIRNTRSECPVCAAANVVLRLHIGHLTSAHFAMADVLDDATFHTAARYDRARRALGLVTAAADGCTNVERYQTLRRSLVRMLNAGRRRCAAMPVRSPSGARGLRRGCRARPTRCRSPRCHARCACRTRTCTTCWARLNAKDARSGPTRCRAVASGGARLRHSLPRRRRAWGRATRTSHRPTET